MKLIDFLGDWTIVEWDERSATIPATHDPEQLDEWLDRFATAETLDDVGIGTPV